MLFCSRCLGPFRRVRSEVCEQSGEATRQGLIYAVAKTRPLKFTCWQPQPKNRFLHCVCVLTACLCLTAATTSWAKVSRLEELAALSLSELFQVKISLTTIRPKPIREQSAIVSVITAREIRASGARDLIDVLWLVPGYHFGVDLHGITGVGIRGFWVSLVIKPHRLCRGWANR